MTLLPDNYSTTSQSEKPEPAPYVGRFAPSPTGPLHFGSLIAALASYLDAKSKTGKWLLRMEDLDPPREPAGAAENILEQLQNLGFDWDGDVLYQSSRIQAYEQAMYSLTEQGMCFYCHCTRPRIQALGSVYDGQCRGNVRTTDSTEIEGAAIRVKTLDQVVTFQDRIQGHFQQNIQHHTGDFVIKRKDKLFAYQLAVVVDDGFQGITDVVRGYDLIDSTPRQIYLQQYLQLATPRYAHFPVAADSSGNKLSKQHFADEISSSQGSKHLLQAMDFLGLSPDPALITETPATLLKWGIAHWDIQHIPKLATITGFW